MSLLIAKKVYQFVCIYSATVPMYIQAEAPGPSCHIWNSSPCAAVFCNLYNQELLTGLHTQWGPFR